MRRRALAAAGVAAGLALLLPATAAAHGLVGKQDLPIPRWLFAWGAAGVLIVSFVALATLWPSPRLQELRERAVWRVPGARALEVLGGAIGVVVFAVVVYAGLAGSQSPQENLAPTFIYYVFWVGIPFLSFLVGDVFRLFNPWRAIARAVAWAATRIAGRGALPEPLEYPRALGRWPAAIGILAFAWVELVYVDRDDPSTLAIMALAYAAVQLVGMSLYGIDPWLRNADPFGVTFSLLSRLAPLRWHDGRLLARRPLAGIVGLDPRPGTVALVCVMIGTTSFDGFSMGTVWNDVAPDLQRVFMDLGIGAETALQIAFTIGLVAMVLLVAALYRLGVEGMRTVGEAHSARELAGAFAHTLVPIALAYLVAHYFSALTYQAQAMAYLISDPLGDGSNLFGTASASIDYGWISANAIWYVQVGALIVGHVCGLILAHDRALALYRDVRAATRSQYWMLVVMVGFTSLGLWLLSAASQ
ncbi:MAG: fenitrothion hydrolase [Solirubrobacteraceae bacterium]|nr:fenitrothion hydrolase [Solirubrobacteraceae bacterium]